MRRTSSRRSIRLHPGQNGRCTDVMKKFRSQNVQIFGYVYQNTSGPNHGPMWKTQSFLLNEICTVILWQAILLLGTWMEKVPHCECLFVQRQQPVFGVDTTSFLWQCSSPVMWQLVISTIQIQKCPRDNEFDTTRQRLHVDSRRLLILSIPPQHNRRTLRGHFGSSHCV